MLRLSVIDTIILVIVAESNDSQHSDPAKTLVASLRCNDLKAPCLGCLSRTSTVTNLPRAVVKQCSSVSSVSKQIMEEQQTRCCNFKRSPGSKTRFDAIELCPIGGQMASPALESENCTASLPTTTFATMRWCTGLVSRKNVRGGNQLRL